jgi:multicomponent K+:H+ antiporter subunit E
MSVKTSTFKPKLLPHPVLSLVLWLLWCLLNNTFAPGHVALGLVLALLIPWLTQGFWQNPVKLSNLSALFGFFARVMKDIFVSNFVVAKLILGQRDRLKPAFIVLELRVKHPLGISLLANTISLTPGTVSCDLSEDRRQLFIHALHCEDVVAIQTDIHQRYEKALMEVFDA